MRQLKLFLLICFGLYPFLSTAQIAASINDCNNINVTISGIKSGPKVTYNLERQIQDGIWLSEQRLFEPKEQVLFQTLDIGTYRVKLIYTYEKNQSADRSDEIYFSNIVTVKNCNLIAKNKGTALIEISPNPTSDQINITYSQFNDSSEFFISIFNFSGTRLSMTKMINEKMSLPIDNLGNGIYLITIEDNATIVAQKKIVFSK